AAAVGRGDVAEGDRGRCRVTVHVGQRAGTAGHPGEQDETPVRGPRAAEGQAGPRNGVARLLAGTGEDLLLVHVAQREEQVAALGVEPPGQVGALLRAVAFAVLAVVERNLPAPEVSPGYDVDDRRDRSPAV